VNKFLAHEPGFDKAAFQDVRADGKDNVIFFAPDVQMIDLADPPGFLHRAQAAYFRYQGFDAVIITIHLAWTDKEQRAKERELLTNVVRQALEADPDVIIAGDFNTTEEPGDTILGLANALGLEILMPENTTIDTTYAGNNYDYILVSPDLFNEEALNDCRIVVFDDEQIASKVSDHRPVIAGFRTDLAYSDWPPSIQDPFAASANTAMIGRP